jgi:hypothetical protein
MRTLLAAVWLFATACATADDPYATDDTSLIDPGSPTVQISPPGPLYTRAYGTLQLSAGADFPHPIYTWKSSNKAIATVDGTGRVSGHAAGIAVITATTSNRGSIGGASVNVTVRAFGELTTAVVSDIPQPQAAIQVNNPKQTYYFTATPRVFAVGDLNGDGIPDIFFAPNMYNARPELPVQIWKGDGKGGFKLATSEVITDATVLTTGAADSIFLADFNGDGALDVFIVDQGLEYPVPFLGNKNKLLLSAPCPALGAPGKKCLHDASSNINVTYNGFNHVSSIADMNGDHCPDIIVTTMGGPNFSHHGTYILYNDCQGHFSHSTTGLAPEIAEEPNLWTPSVDYQNTGTNGTGDLDGDGRPELVTGSYRDTDLISGKKTLLVHHNVGGTSFPRTTVLPFPAALASVPYFPGEQPGSNPFGLGAANIAIGDLDGDGRAEIVVNWEGSQNSTIQVFHNDGNLAFHDITTQVYGGYETSFPNSSGETTFAQKYEIRDVDGDGWNDLVMTFYDIDAPELAGQNGIWLNDRSGTGHLVPWHFTKYGVPASVADVTAAFPELELGVPNQSWQRSGIPLVFDADGDGVNDVVIVNCSALTTGSTAPSQTTDMLVYTFLSGPR